MSPKLKSETSVLLQSSNLVSSLEMELSKMKVQAHILEQENHIMKQELENTKQVWYPVGIIETFQIESSH